jgi:ABC-type multidrug transport system fused ATPase/permease subunit
MMVVPKETASKKAAKMKRELEALEGELGHLIEVQWTYTKRMLKFGAAAWALGLSIFFLGVIISDPALLSKTPPISISLLAFAAAVPVLITVAMIYKFTSKIRRLERSRRKLLMEYEKALLKRVGEIITKSK